MNYLKDKENLNLNGTWKLSYAKDNLNFKNLNELSKSGLKELNATVPGNFELDLQKNGLIDDPFFGMNIKECFKYELEYMWYYRTFDMPNIDKNSNYELVFEGVDTLCDIYLNGELIAVTDNMLVEHFIDVAPYLKDKNELIVKISPIYYEAIKQDYPIQTFALPSNYEGLYIRKAPHMYGWDIMCRAVSAGIWKNVYIRKTEKERLNFVYAITDRLDSDHKDASLRFTYNGEIGHAYSNFYEIEIIGECKDSKINIRKQMLFGKGSIEYKLDNPLLWWPRGKGDANLYNMKAILYKDGNKIDEITFNFGVRTIKLERTDTTDQFGSGEFVFIINGEKVFCKGSNWVPMDAYHSRDEERIPKALDMIVDLECNILRCWGGNVYENDLFYNICDEKGIMVWQDFAIACGYFPQSSDFLNKLTVEGTKVVRRLRQHPSIILWSGDNEVDIFLSGLNENIDPATNAITRNIWPDVLKQEDYTRPYLPSSPYLAGDSYKYGETRAPENHPWGPRDYFKGKYYSNQVCHFASEIGYHGCPMPEALEQFISKDKLWPYENNEEWILHSTSPIPGYDCYDYRVELMAKQVRELFGFIPDNLKDFAIASQISQAEAKKFFIEMFRTAKWRRTGIIWWNLIDGWPEISDAIVDYNYNKKLAYEFIKTSQQHVCLMFKEPENWNIELVVSNDTRLNEDLEYIVTDIKNNNIVTQGTIKAFADRVTSVIKLSYTMSLKTIYKIEWKGKKHSGINHYLTGMPTYDFEEYQKLIKKIYTVNF